jgi:phage terminase Nu1 subunit (DNA packaging protein)
MADPKTYPGGTIAKLLNISQRRVQQLAAEGVIPRAERGKFPLVESIRGYIKYLQDRAVGNDSAPLDIHADRARLTRAQADKIELELDELRGSLIRVPIVENHWQGMVASMRARLLSIPSKCAGQIAEPAKAQAAQDVLQTHIYDALNEIAGDPIPRAFRDRIAAQTRNSDEGSRETAAEAENLGVGA